MKTFVRALFSGGSLKNMKRNKAGTERRKQVERQRHHGMSAEQAMQFKKKSLSQGANLKKTGEVEMQLTDGGIIVKPRESKWAVV